MPHVIVCAGLVGQMYSGQTTAPVGAYLRDYLPEARDGRGEVVWTNDLRQAMRFDSFMQATQEWRRVPENRPTREDGRPNRPLTAFSVEIAEVSDE